MARKTYQKPLKGNSYGLPMRHPGFRKIGDPPSENFNAKSIESSVADTTSVIVNTAKCSVILSTLIGTVGLVVYLKKTSAPFPIVDSSLSIFVTLIAAISGGIFFILGTTVTSVVFINKLTQTEVVKEILPYLRPNLSRNKRGLRQAFWAYFIPQYILMYLWLFAFLITYPVVYRRNLMEFFDQTPLLQHPLSMPFLYGLRHVLRQTNVLIATYRSYIFSGRPVEQSLWEFFLCLLYTLLVVIGILVPIFLWGFVGSSFRYKRERFSLKMQATLKLTLISLLSSFLSIIWVIWSLTILNKFVNNEAYASWATLFVLCFVLYFHLLSNASQLSDLKTSVFMLIIFSFGGLSFYGVANCTAVTLRVLGIGGGIPSTIFVKLPVSVNNHVVVEAVHGCIIIATSSQLAIHPTDDKEQCSLKYALRDALKPPETYQLVDVYSRSDISRISKW